ncbi:MAG TPA: hypothetical protein VK970_02715 [Candidatus Methylacidiphilales bacterium]|nr:hypothetical protein [Candidatus Methylacidiphilales bacterium]
MNLTEIERMVSRIVDLMRNPDAASPAAAATLAEQYSRVCRETSLRLDQCAAVLGTGNQGQVIQLAEAQPPLLDVMARLGFPKSQVWSDFCRKHGLPVADSFDAAVIRQLNEAYSQGIPPNHPLYREYRGLTMKGKFEEALTTLRSILRLNPGDENARRELGRVEKQVVDARLKSLATVVATGNRSQVLEAIDELDATGLDRALLAGPVYTRACEMRTALLREEALAEWLGFLPQLQNYQKTDRWQAAAGLLKHMEQLRNSQSLTPDAEAQRTVSEATRWVGICEHEQKTEAEFTAAVQHLESILGEADQGLASRSLIGEQAMQTALGKVENCWRSLERFARPLPPSLVTRHQRCVMMLNATIAHSRRVKSRWMMALAAAVLAVVGIITYIVLANQTAGRLVLQLESQEKGRQVSGAQKLLSEIEKDYPSYASRPDVAKAISNANVFISRENALRTAFEDAAQAFQSAVTTPAEAKPNTEAPDPAAAAAEILSDAAAIAAQMRADHAASARDALADEFRMNASSRLSPIVSAWQKQIEASLHQRTEKFRGMLDVLEKEAQTDLSISRRLDELQPVATAFFSKLAQLTALEDAPIASLKMPGDLTTRLGTLKHSTETVRKAMADLEQSLLTMKNATRLEDYMRAVEAAAKSPLSFEDKSSLEALPALKPGQEALALHLIFGGERDSYEFFQANPKAGLCPTSPLLLQEKKVYDDVLSDPNIRNVFRYSIEMPSDTENSVVSRGRLDSEGQGIVYNQSLMPKRLFFVSAQVKVKQDFGRTEVSQTMEDIGFRDMVDGDPAQFVPGTGGAPVHLAIERVARRDKKKLSAQFKAYFVQKMYELLTTGQRENFFGLQYSPALKQLVRELNSATQPVSGSWFVVDTYKTAEPPLVAIFDKVGMIPFSQQARALQRLVRDAMEEGFVYQGFVDKDGKLVRHTATSTPARIFGWGKTSNKPELLFQLKGEGDNAAYESVATGIPYTPCFSYRGSIEGTLEAAQRSTILTAEEFTVAVTPWLPPLFK